MATVDKTRAHFHFTTTHAHQPMFQQNKLITQRSDTITELIKELKSKANNESSQTSKRKLIKSKVAKPGNVVPISKILMPLSCEPSKLDGKSIVRHDSPNNGSGIERTEFQSSVNNENGQTSKRKCIESKVAKPGNVVPISKILIPLSCEPSKVDSKSIVRHDSPNNASGIERNLGKGKLSSHQEVVSNDVLPPLKKKKSDLKIYCHCRISNEMHNKKIL